MSHIDKRYQGIAPTVQFGIHVTTHVASVAVDNAWNPFWEKVWVQQMRSLYYQEDLANKPEVPVVAVSGFGAAYGVCLLRGQ